MPRIMFSGHKQRIAEFEAETLNFTKDNGGLLVTAEGEMVFQDTPSVENMLNANTPIHITIINNGDTVVDDSFQVSFFTLEMNTLAMLLQ